MVLPLVGSASTSQTLPTSVNVLLDNNGIVPLPGDRKRWDRSQKRKAIKAKSSPNEQKPGETELALIPTNTADVGQDPDLNGCHGGLASKMTPEARPVGGATM